MSVPGPGAQDSPVADDGLEAELAVLGERLGELIEGLTQHPDPAVGKQVEEVLESFDRLHREALRRVAGLLVHHELLGHACADPVVGMVFDLYELAPDEVPSVGNGERSAAANGQDPGRLQAPTPPPSGVAAPMATIRLQDIRRFTPAAPAVVDGDRERQVSLPGARPVADPAADTLTARASGPAPTPVIPTPSVARGVPTPSAPRATAGPVGAPAGATVAEPSSRDAPQGWTRLFPLTDLPPDTPTASADGTVLLCSLGGVVHAVRNRCGDSPLPLQYGEIVGDRLRCPWHKRCEYELVTGESTSERRTIVYPVQVEDGFISVALDQGRATGPLQPPGTRAPR